MAANKTHPTKGIRTGVPTLRVPTVLKLNNNAAGFSLASHGAPNSSALRRFGAGLQRNLRDAIKPRRQIR
jgi:hypothetical protein